jgi:regulator of sigma E protease
VELRLTLFWHLYIYRDGPVYGDTYIANADMKDGLLIENQAMLNAGFKTGDKIISVDGTKIMKFDNDINMKVVLGKEILIERNGTQETIKMPIDFIDQLSKFEPYWTSEGRLSLVQFDESTNKDQAKDVVVTLNGQAAKYIDQAKLLENNKGKTISATVLRDQKRKNPVTINNDGVLGVPAGLSFASMEKIRLLQSKPTRIWFLRIYSSRD